ncbi:Transmembrane protease serine 12 [Collichthys lucidus]|uniref:Acrosin n=1 Tax=Collichthys lucidus TaxID=240159 RepID=A0A4U5URM7_COLLU|nr:Transmembrane protease serine 12 [Collichthys lucidus]
MSSACNVKQQGFTISDTLGPSCLVNRSYFRVAAGLRVLSAPGNQTQFRSIHNIIIHKDYNDVTSENDVTLLLLSSPFKFNDHVQPVCAPHNVTHESNLNFSHCFITGWGSKYYKGSLMNRLQEAEVELIDRRTCNLVDWYNGIITENMICAGLDSGAADTCQGDSGGPLQCYSEEEERFYLVGVTSFGFECGRPQSPWGVCQSQPVCRLAADKSDAISVSSTQTEHKTDLSSAWCCSDAALKHPDSLSAINITAIQTV